MGEVKTLGLMVALAPLFRILKKGFELRPIDEKKVGELSGMFSFLSGETWPVRLVSIQSLPDNTVNSDFAGEIIDRLDIRQIEKLLNVCLWENGACHTEAQHTYIRRRTQGSPMYWEGARKEQPLVDGFERRLYSKLDESFPHLQDFEISYPETPLEFWLANVGTLIRLAIGCAEGNDKEGLLRCKAVLELFPHCIFLGLHVVKKEWILLTA